uniref:Reverse transcriptase domain-containing protein n=1 Tax=Tanacetum cinerariifolium TaxID=118510 RepID=A0A6L2JLH9_TANCI|nr:reverse transcriptase domain-containing protein [Tanacetum cinerariifolium]
MSTQQDIYAAGSENHPFMLKKNNYVLWSSRIIRYARSRYNGKMIVDSIENGPYVRQMIATLGEPDLPVPVPETFHEQTEEELTENDIKQIDADDQAIQAILLGLPKDVYTAVDSSNFKFLNNLQPEWKRHITIVRQTKNLHEADFTQIYDFLKMNQDEVNELRAERLAKTHDPLALMAHSQNSYNFLATHNDQSSSSTHSQQSFPINNKIDKFRILEEMVEISLDSMLDKWHRISKGIMHGRMNGTGNIVAARAECTGNRNQVRIQLQAEEFNFMAAADDMDEIEEVNANCILMVNLQHASTYGTQLDKAPVYDTDGSAEYTDLLEPIPEPQLVPQNDNHVTSISPSMMQSGGTVETSFAPNEETRAHQETVYHNLIDQVAQVNMVNCNMRATNAELKSELARYKIQEQRVFVPQMPKSKEELFLSNVSNMVTISKMISIPNEDLSSDTTPSVAQKFLNEVKNYPVTLQRVVKQKMTLEVHNWSSSAHKEVHNIISHEIDPIINHVDARVQNFDIQFLKEASKFVRDFKSLVKEADESLDKQKSLELEIKRLLKVSVSHDIMSIVQNGFVDVPSDLQTELDRTKEKLEHCIIKKEKEYVVLWNNWYTKCEECKYEQISYDKAYNDMQQKIERLQAQLGDLKVYTTRTRRPQPKGNTRNAKIPSASKSSEAKKNVTVEDHRRILSLFKNQKTMSFECNNIKLAIQNDKSKIICDTYKQCFVTANHDACLLSSVNALNSHANNLNLFPPLDNPELTIKKRSRSDPTLLNNSEMAAEENGNLTVPDLRTMEELCQPSLNGRVQNSCQFHGLSGDNANKHLDKFLHVTQSIKVNGVTDDALRLYLFPHSLTHHATAWFDRLPRNSINTFEQMAKMFPGKYFPPSMVTKLRNEITNFWQHTVYNGLTLRHRDTINVAARGTFMKRRPEECYDLIKNITAHHNDCDTSDERSESSSFITSSYTKIIALKAKMVEINKNLMRVHQVNQQVKVVTLNYETCGGPHPSMIFQPPLATLKTYMLWDPTKANEAILKNMQTNMTSLTNLNLELKNMLVQFMKMNTASSLGSGTLSGNTITNPKKDLKGITTRSRTAYPGPTITTTSSSSIVERGTEANKDTFGPSIKSLFSNKDKLSELTRTPLNKHCSVVLLKKLPEKLGDPGKFLILCNFPKMAECLALADLGASINLMPLSIWNNISFPNLSPTYMTLELTDRLISRPVKVEEDVFVKVGTFHFPADFVVVDFDADPRVPLILGRSFLKTERALIDVFKGELTLRVGKEAITFNLDRNSRYSANYNDMTEKRIDVIDMACEEYLQEVLSFSDMIANGNPTPYYDPIVSTTSSTLTPFKNSDFLLEEVDAFLAIEDDPTSSKVDQSYLDTERDIELKICEAKTDKSLIDEPLEVELKDLPPHFEYAFLEGDDKLPVNIPKDLSVEEKTALITEKTTFTSPYEKFTYRPMPFGLCNAPGTFQRCMMAIFYDMIKKTMEVFMDDFSVFRNSFQSYFSHLENILKRCEDPNLCLNWEKSQFMVKEGIVLGHKFSKEGIEVDKSKVDVITKLPHPTTVKGIRSFLGYAGFYRRFIKGFSKIARPMTRLFEKDTHSFSPKSVEAFQTLKRKLTQAPILIALDWDMPFELMCDASDFAIGVVLGIVYTDNSAHKYLFAKKDSKARLLRWVLFLQEFTFKVIDTKGDENLAADHLSRLENPHQNVLDPKEINESFPLETLNLVSTHGNSSTPWFAGFANYHAGNFVVKGMSS